MSQIILCSYITYGNKIKLWRTQNRRTARRSSQDVQIMRSYKEFPEISKLTFNDGKDSIMVDTMFKDGQFYLSLENTEKVAKWAIIKGMVF